MGMQCRRGSGAQFTKAGRDRQERQLFQSRACGRRITARSGSAFSGYRYPDEVIALAVRWYLRFRLSYADVVEWLAERGIHVDPSTIYDGVRAFTPRFCVCQANPRPGRWTKTQPPYAVDDPTACRRRLAFRR